MIAGISKTARDGYRTVQSYEFVPGAWPIVSSIHAGQHLRIGEFAPDLVAEWQSQLIARQGQELAQLTYQIEHGHILGRQCNRLMCANHIRQKHAVLRIEGDFHRLAAQGLADVIYWFRPARYNYYL
jgi:hypothetical protein